MIGQEQYPGTRILRENSGMSNKYFDEISAGNEAQHRFAVKNNSLDEFELGIFRRLSSAALLAFFW
jgi:hypothetical protein